jgi:hypothetical protein
VSPRFRPVNSKVITYDQTQSRRWSRVDAAFELKEHTVAVPQTAQDVKSNVATEIAKVYIPAFARLSLKVLMQEGEAWSGTNVCRPAALPRRNRQSVNGLQIQCEKRGNLTECKFYVWTEVNVWVEEGAHLRMHAQQDEFWIEGHACANTRLEAAQLPFNVTFGPPYLRRNGLRWLLRTRALRSRGCLQSSDRARDANPRLFSRDRNHTTVDPTVRVRGFSVSRSNTNKWYWPFSPLTTNVLRVADTTAPVNALSSR